MKAVSSSTTIPIFTGIKIVQLKKVVTLTGSDADISIESFIPIKMMEKKLLKLNKQEVLFYMHNILVRLLENYLNELSKFL